MTDMNARDTLVTEALLKLVEHLQREVAAHAETKAARAEAELHTAKRIAEWLRAKADAANNGLSFATLINTAVAIERGDWKAERAK